MSAGSKSMLKIWSFFDNFPQNLFKSKTTLFQSASLAPENVASRFLSSYETNHIMVVLIQVQLKRGYFDPTLGGLKFLFMLQWQ